jgi:zinc finger protein
MRLLEIPFFKSIIVMCTSCDNCGHRSNEVKSGNGRIIIIELFKN